MIEDIIIKRENLKARYIIVPIHVREMWASSSGIIAVWTSALKVVRKRSTSVASL